MNPGFVGATLQAMSIVMLASLVFGDISNFEEAYEQLLLILAVAWIGNSIVIIHLENKIKTLKKE